MAVAVAVAVAGLVSWSRTVAGSVGAVVVVVGLAGGAVVVVVGLGDGVSVVVVLGLAGVGLRVLQVGITSRQEACQFANILCWKPEAVKPLRR
jgi:hypothetical protein